MNIALDKDRKATVYDPEGNAHLVSRQDAVEYLASGHYTLEPPKAESPKVAPVGAPTAPAVAAPPVATTTLHVPKK